MSSSTSTPDEAAAQDRITSHMNASHKRELSHYLRHHANLSANAASSPWLKSLNKDGMTIAAGGLGGREFLIPFSPPLDSLSEARPRVIAMDAEAREALGLSDVYVSEYTVPRGFDIVIFAAVAFYFLCYLTLSHVLPGTPIWSFLTTLFPGGPRAYRWLVKTIFLPVLAIHVGEVIWIHRTRLVPHGIVTGSKLWWCWTGSTFFEGLAAFRRFDGLVREKRAQKESKSH